MSNLTNAQIIDNLLDTFQEKGGNVRQLFERNDFSKMSEAQIIHTLKEEINELPDEDDYSPDYPIGKNIEPYDMERDNNLM